MTTFAWQIRSMVPQKHIMIRSLIWKPNFIVCYAGIIVCVLSQWEMTLQYNIISLAGHIHKMIHGKRTIQLPSPLTTDNLHNVMHN